MLEHFSLQLCLSLQELLLCDGQLGPLAEDLACRGPWSALQLGFYGPGQVWSAVLAEDGVCHFGVGVFGVYEEAIHVEYACPHGREGGTWARGGHDGQWLF